MLGVDHDRTRQLQRVTVWLIIGISLLVVIGSAVPAVASGTGIDRAGESLTSQSTLTTHSSVSGCTNITTSGVHELTQNVSASQTCLIIKADDVILDGRGHHLIGSNVTRNSTGLGVAGASNVTIRNLSVTGWDTLPSVAIVAAESEALTIENVSATSNWAGILIGNAPNVTVSRTSIKNSVFGLDISHSPDGQIDQVEASGNSDGIVVADGSDRTVLSNLSTSDNSHRGIALINSTDTVVDNVTSSRNGDGIEAYNTTDGMFVDSLLQGNIDGLHIGASHNVSLTRMAVESNSNIGVRFDSTTTASRLVDGWVENNRIGILLENSSTIAINGSSTVGNERGTLVRNGARNTTISNHQSFNERVGIRAQDTAGLALNQVTLSNATEYGLLTTESSDLLVNGTVARNGSTGFGLENVTDATITWSGVGFENTGLEVRQSANVSVAYSEFGHLTGQGISIANTTNASLESVAAVNSSLGVEVLDSESATIRESYLAQTDIGGILAQRSPSVSIQHNTVNASGQTIPDGFGIAVVSATGATVTNNTVTTASGPGVYLEETSASNLIENTAQNATAGILLQSTSNVTVSGSTAMENDIAGVAAMASSGLDFDGVTAAANGEAGIGILAGTVNTTVTDPIAHQNAGAGIIVNASNRSVIANATAVDNGYAGVVVNGSAQETTIANGSFDSNGAYGISVLNGSVGTSVQEATARNNGDAALRTDRSGSTTASELDIGDSTVPGTTLSVTASNVSLSAIGSVPSHPTRTGIGRYVRVESTTVAPSIDLDMWYEQDDVSGVIPSSLALQRFDGTAWSPLQNASLDTGTGVISGSSDAAGIIGAVAEPAANPIRYNMTLELDGTATALGIPGPLDGTLADVLPTDPSAVSAVFTYTGGSWELLTDLDADLEPRDAIVLVTADRGETAPLSVPIARNTSAMPRQTTAGWNFVSGHALSDAETAFGGNATADSLLVLDRFDRPTASAYGAVPGFDSYVIGSHEWGAGPPAVDPFGGYFVYFQAGDELPVALSNVSDRTAADDRLEIGP